MTYSSLFAYLADGHNGLRVVQLTSPKTPGNGGFHPRPQPRLIATLTEGTAARVGVLDPLGVGSRPGADAYFELMTRLATSLRDCLLAAR